jgi:hypothetical protein
MKLDDPYFNFIKHNWKNHKNKIGIAEPKARLGDAIQVTAILDYFKKLGIQVFFGDWSPNVNTTYLFPPDLYTYTRNVLPYIPVIDIFHPWVWAPYLKDIGVYTRLSRQYDINKNHEYDVVFVPCLEPDYHKGRGIKPQNAVDIFQRVKKNYRNCRMVVDAAKRHIIPSDDPDIVASRFMETTFKMIENSKIYIGCDTGTTHYAGGIGHPRMALLYPDESVFVDSWLHKLTLAYIFDHPQLLNYETTCLPGCNPKQYRALRLHNNEIHPEAVLSLLWNM